MGSAVGAATPRSVRKVKRTAFNATHPVNTAENALLNAATPKRGRRPNRKGDGLSGAANAAIFVFIFVALIVGLVAGDGGAKVGAIVAGSVAVCVYVLWKIGEVAGRTQAPSARATPNDPATETYASYPDTVIVVPLRVTQAWLQHEVPSMSVASFELLLEALHSRGWRRDEIEQRILPLRKT
ncbi:MAG TPA: hypothetical protein VNX67_05290 [Solirubrobacteraceae bacterium]|nr:hypothetical protein [Solirubrobacteraceae bacterium]